MQQPKPPKIKLTKPSGRFARAIKRSDGDGNLNYEKREPDKGDVIAHGTTDVNGYESTPIERAQFIVDTIRVHLARRTCTLHHDDLSSIEILLGREVLWCQPACNSGRRSGASMDDYPAQGTSGGGCSVKVTPQAASECETASAPSVSAASSTSTINSGRHTTVQYQAVLLISPTTSPYVSIAATASSDSSAVIPAPIERWQMDVVCDSRWLMASAPKPYPVSMITPGCVSVRG